MGMFKRISVLLLSALLTVGLTAPVALAAPHTEDHGLGESTEDKDTGEPTDAGGKNVANDFGTVTSQLGTTEHSVGEHSSDPVPDRCFGLQQNCRETPRDGVGNVSRTDSCDPSPCSKEEGPSLEDRINSDPDPTNNVEDAGGRPGHHAALIDGIDGNDFTDVNENPGLPEDCRGPAQQRTGDCVAT